MAKDLQISERCIFAGRRQHEEIPLWLSAADCLVIPSHMEGFPTILPEAMLCRVPVVATAVGGVPEVVNHGTTGFLVEPGNVSELARAMADALSDSGLAAAVVGQAESFARENLTWQANARRVVSVYEDMLHDSRRPQRQVLTQVPPFLPRV